MNETRTSMDDQTVAIANSVAIDRDRLRCHLLEYPNLPAEMQDALTHLHLAEDILVGFAVRALRGV